MVELASDLLIEREGVCGDVFLYEMVDWGICLLKGELCVLGMGSDGEHIKRSSYLLSVSRFVS